MKITIAVDAPPIFSALLGGSARRLFFDARFRLITTEFTVSEVEGYIPFIAERSGKSEDEIRRAMRLLPLHVYAEMDYQQMKPNAADLIAERDPKDVDILALALTMHTPLWTEDRDFEEITAVTIVRTQDLI